MEYIDQREVVSVYMPLDYFIIAAQERREKSL